MKTAKRKATKRVAAKSKPKKPSGWDNVKRRREKARAAIEAAGIDNSELIPKIGALETVEDFKREIADVYRRTRCGQIHNSDASRLTYICAEGAKLARVVDELRELESLRQQLQRLNGGAALPHTLTSRGDFISEQEADAS